MIKYIIHISDVHIRSFQRHEEYREVLTNFLNDIKIFVEEHPNEVILLNSGDVFDNKLAITNESQIFLAWFFQELDKLCPNFYVLGNHDFIQSNTQRVNSIEPIFEIGNFKQTYFLDKILEYQSGQLVYNNIVFYLYSIMDNYDEPDVQIGVEENPDKIHIGLIHAPIVGSKTDIGFFIDRGVDPNIFPKELNYVLAGDIHKFQKLRNKNNVQILYPGSLLQINFGENVSGHGYSIITLPDFTIEHREVENPYVMYKFEINDVNDIENNMEILKNK